MFKSYRLYLLNHFRGGGGTADFDFFFLILWFGKIRVLNIYTELFQNMYKTAAAVYMDLKSI